MNDCKLLPVLLDFHPIGEMFILDEGRTRYAKLLITSKELGGASKEAGD